MSSEKPTQYRSILKGISLFGGVKVFEILINLIRGKFVALFLGPEGMGVNAIFSNSTTTLSQLSSLGLNLAIAKEVAVRKEDKGKLQEIIEVTLRLTLLTALAGGVVCVLFSAWLSELSFGTDAYRWQFMLLGIAVFLFVSNGSRLAMLQGLHEVKRLSRASLVGSVTGLLAGVPLYWLFGTHGIVPAIIILALSLHIFYTVNLRKSVTGVSFRTFPAKLSLKGDTPLVKRLLSLGIILVAGDVIANICNYLLIIGRVGFRRTVPIVGQRHQPDGLGGICRHGYGLLSPALGLQRRQRVDDADRKPPDRDHHLGASPPLSPPCGSVATRDLIAFHL